jgi:hypothetical protein
MFNKHSLIWVLETYGSLLENMIPYFGFKGIHVISLQIAPVVPVC